MGGGRNPIGEAAQRVGEPGEPDKDPPFDRPRLFLTLTNDPSGCRKAPVHGNEKGRDRIENREVWNGRRRIWPCEMNKKRWIPFPKIILTIRATLIHIKR